MKVAKNGDFMMNQKDVVEFSSWLDKNPRERFKRFNEVIQVFMDFRNNSQFYLNNLNIEKAQ